MEYDLDNFGFLVGETARLLGVRFDEEARAHRITRTQWLVLLTLMRNEGASQNQMAELLEVEPITLSRMIDRLEAAGHVTRAVDPADRRVRRLHLTDSGRAVLRELRLMGADVLAEASRGMSPEQVERFMGLLRRFRANLVAAAARPPEES
jgi:DNA-binding MarR family transcriptional regulator